jgi:hypothetical protein
MMPWPRATVFALAALAALSAWACSGDRAGGSGTDADHRGVLLSSDLVLGADHDAPPEYQFSGIRRLLPHSDGSLWVLDSWGPFDMQSSIRRFDAHGTFLGYVSSGGGGPGEFLIPQSLVELSDGRVLLTDQRRPNRLTVFSADGVVDEEIRTEHGFTPVGGAVVDDRGRIWLLSSTQPRPGPNRPPSFWMIVGTDGVLIDTIHPPVLPVLNEERLAWVSDDGVTTRGFGLPYRPRAHQALSRSGDFLVAQEDEYEIYRVDRETGNRTLAISRPVPRVEVSAGERAALREATRTSIREFAQAQRVAISLEVPEVPSVKPYLRSISQTPDGGTLVWVSMPSMETSAGWIEPTAFDLFDREDRFRGRFVVPEGYQLWTVRDEAVWTRFVDELGVESLHRFPLPFGDGR